MQMLIVGPLNGQIGAASRMAMERGAKVTHCGSIGEAMEILRSGSGAQLAVIDVDLDVGQLVDGLAQERINVPVVACGIGNDTGAAVRAIKAGAREYLPLPPDADLIAAVLEAASDETHAIVFRDPAMRAVLDLAKQIAPSEASVLVSGESGTGKELLARFVHRESRRAEQNFVSVNCAAIPETLLESELFGHEKGAFTGAVARRIGRFEEASGGTLLLDEISEMDVRLQAKLLRAIQEREISRLGGNQAIPVDIRLIATSNRDLRAEVAKGTFREDLLFRLNVINLQIPPLRQRPADVVPLAEHFAEKYAAANGMANKPLGADAIVRITGLQWRGNVRELENTIHRAVLLSRGDEIEAEAILVNDADTATAEGAQSETGASAQSSNGSTTTAALVGRTVADVERDLIIDTLRHCIGNRTHAANILGISIRTLRNKLRQYTDEGIPVPMPGAVERPAL